MNRGRVAAIAVACAAFFLAFGYKTTLAAVIIDNTGYASYSSDLNIYHGIYDSAEVTSTLVANSISGGTTFYIEYRSGSDVSTCGGSLYVSSNVVGYSVITGAMPTSTNTLIRASGIWTGGNTNAGESIHITNAHGSTLGTCDFAGTNLGYADRSPTERVWWEPWLCITTDPTYSDCGAAAVPTISWIFPTNGTTTGPFYYWDLNTTGVDTSTPTIVIVASQLNATNTLNFSSPSNDGAIYYSGSTEQQIPANLPPTVWPTSTYYVEAGLFKSGSSTPIAQTGIISFTLSIAATSSQNPNGTITTGETSTTIAITGNCQFTSSSFFADPIGVIENSICGSISFLFLPNSPEQKDLAARFTNIQKSISKKPPFGYYSAFAGSIGTLQSSTPAFAVVNPTSTSAFSAIFTPIRSGFAWLLWILFGFWAFHRFRHFIP